MASPRLAVAQTTLSLLMSTTSSDTSSSYIALVPRGLHHVFRKRLRTELEAAGYSLQKVECVVELVEEEEPQYHAHLQELLSKRKKQHSPNIGSVMDPVTNKHVSVGYATNDDSDDARHSTSIISSYAGTSSPVWVKFTTNAPVHFVNTQLRFIGPLLACVQVFGNVDFLKETTTLDDVQRLAGQLKVDSTKLDEALSLWHDHVVDSWPLSEQELNEINAKMQSQQQDDDNNTSTTQPMTYRLSCMRAQSKQYSYTREQFIRVMANHVIPSLHRWKVNLCNYDVEVVLLVQASCFAVGLALRPYRQLNTTSFSKGGIPPDVTMPLITGDTLSGLVRLRPTTAQLLWGMLSLEKGDVVLDPCAGIGTVPLEVPPGVIGLGGDLILQSEECRSLAAEYTQKMYQHNASNKTNLLAWDASILPLRDACVDAVVSDLPFGQQCLSSSKLDALIPLILGECARVLRPGGTMLLLCGAFPIILDSLASLNGMQTNGAVWKLPCDAVFPVNIGGLIAWVVKVERGPADAIPVANYAERVRKLAAKREQISKSQSRQATKDGGLKYRRLQK